MKIFTTLLVMLLTTIIGFWSLIVGWGLTPKNWAVIITALVVNMILTVVNMAIISQKN